jgi:hypothetical protein
MEYSQILSRVILINRYLLDFDSRLIPNALSDGILERYKYPDLYPNTPPALSLGMVQDNGLMPSLGILQDEESTLGILQDDSNELSDGIFLDSPHELINQRTCPG